VLRLAREKAAARTNPGEIVLGADTIVVLDGELLGKPADEAHAKEMLARIAGREHTVHTGVALHQPSWPEGETGPLEASDVDTSRVRMAALGPAEIDWYVGTGEPLDKAGSYAVQGIGGLFVESIEGNHHNVVGLPLPLTRRLFARLGYEILDFRP
jgi:septum formation protein